MSKPPPLDVALVVVVNALLSVVATYAVLRAYDVFFNREPNPATVMWSAHIAMFWRLGIGAYLGGMAAIVSSILARRNIDRAMRFTAALVPIVGALIAFQGAFLP